MKTRKKRLLSILTCVAMLIAMVPMNVFAADEPKGTHYEENIVLEGQTPNAIGQYEITLPDLKYYEDTVTVNIKHTPKGHNCDEYFKYLGADEFKYMYIPAEPPFYPESEEYSTTGLLFIARETTNPIYVAFKIKDNYYSLYDGNTTAITKPFIVNANTNYNVDIQHNFLQSIFGTNYEMTDTTSLDTLLDKVELVVFKDATFNNKIASYKWSDLIETTYDCPGHNRGYTFNMYYDAQNNLCISNLAAEASIVYTVNGTEYAVGAQVDVNGETITIKKYDEATQTYTYTFDNSVFSERDKVTLSYCASDDVVESNIVLDIDLEATHKTVDTSPEVTTVTVTPTVSVVDMPADGTKTEGFDITFKSNVPVVLTTQEAPDTSVCSITTKQSEGSYTGVYHVGEVGNTNIKFNVKPTVASTMSDDGLTKTVYNSTSYTLKINAFTSDYKIPDDITDAEDEVIDDDDVITEVPEGDTPSGDDIDDEDGNKPGNIPATGDNTNITLYLVIMLASLTGIVFCVRHKSKAKKALMIILVCAMIGGSISGPSMVPTTTYAADEGLGSIPPVSSGGGSIATGNPCTSSVYSTAWIFTLVDTSRIDTFLSNGWQASTLQAVDMSCVYLVGSDHANKYAKNKQIWVQYETSGNSGRNLSLHSKSDLINLLYANVSLTKPAASSDMATILNPLYAIDDNETKAKITNSLFNKSYTAAQMATKNIVAVPIFVYVNKGGTNYYGLTQMYHYKTGLSVYAHPCMGNSWGATTLNQWAWNYGYPTNAHNSLFFKDTVHSNMTKTIQVGTQKGDENAPYTIKEWGGIGSIFKAGADKTPVLKTENTIVTKTAYSSYINFALDNKNTTAKSTYDSISGSTGYAGYDNRITFTHNFKLTKTYVDDVLKSSVYTDAGYSKSGSLTSVSGTKVTNNSVFNSQGYAIVGARSAGGATPFPYIEYKWVPSSTGGIGNKWSLDITTKGGTCSGITNYFTAVSQYQGYLGSTSIPTLSNMLSMLSKNANESGTNRFSNSAYMKFVAGSSTALNSFTSLPSSANSVYNLNQSCYSDLAVITATYTPINVTSKIVMVDLGLKDNKVVVKSVADGTSKTYSNQSSTTFTTPAGYTYYKATAYGTANPAVGSEVTNIGLTSCNNTTLTVGSSAIDKGYTIFCYKIIDGPEDDNSPFNYNISSYVKENYVNNIDFVYTDYNSGWKHATTPTVSGSLNTIYNNWTGKMNTIIPGCVEADVDIVSKLAHQRTFMFNVNRGAYQTLNLSPFISGMNSFANTNGLAGISAQVSTNKSGVTTMNSGTTVNGSAPNRYNNYYGVTNKTVFKPTGTLIGQPNIWKGTTDAFTISGFIFNRAKITYNNTTYVGVYTAPSIGTQSVTDKNLVAAGKTYAEVSNTGVKLSFVPHYEMRVMKTGDTTSPYNHAGRIFNRVSVMSNYQRSFNAAMLSGYRFDSLTPEGKTVSDYVDNSGNTLKGSDMTLTVTDTGLRFNTYAYVLDIYGDGDANEKINGYNPASQWGINSYSSLVSKVNAKFSAYTSNAQNNLAYSVTLDNEGKKYKDFTVSKANATINSSVTTDNNVYQLTIKNGAIVNDTAYQNMLKQIKSDFSLASTTEAETMFKNSGIVDMIMNSMHTSAAANNTSTDKWYDEGTNTICIRRFAKEGMKVASNLVVQDKVDYDSKTGDAEWSLTIKNGSTVVLEDKIEDAEFEISDKTTQSN